MQFLQILAVLASGIIGIWIVGVFLIAAFSPKVKGIGILNLVIGIPLLALAVWLPFAFGWVAS